MPRRDPKSFLRHFTLDYFRRPRSLRRWKLWLSLAAMLVSAGVLVAAIVNPHWHSAFQAGPLSPAHAMVAHDCTACHDKPFATAARFVPGSEASSVSDT